MSFQDSSLRFSHNACNWVVNERFTKFSKHMGYLFVTSYIHTFVVLQWLTITMCYWNIVGDFCGRIAFLLANTSAVAKKTKSVLAALQTTYVFYPHIQTYGVFISI